MEERSVRKMKEQRIVAQTGSPASPKQRAHDQTIHLSPFFKNSLYQIYCGIRCESTGSWVLRMRAVGELEEHVTVFPLYFDFMHDLVRFRI
jgi:hypothetical protein